MGSSRASSMIQNRNDYEKDPGDGMRTEGMEPKHRHHSTSFHWVPCMLTPNQYCDHDSATRNCLFGSTSPDSGDCALTFLECATKMELTPPRSWGKPIFYR